jgi:hypothetical protein
MGAKLFEHRFAESGANAAGVGQGAVANGSQVERTEARYATIASGVADDRKRTGPFRTDLEPLV